jgi:hypothetical protein
VKKYKLSFLPFFEEDLSAIVNYILTDFSNGKPDGTHAIQHAYQTCSEHTRLSPLLCIGHYNISYLEQRFCR